MVNNPMELSMNKGQFAEFLNKAIGYSLYSDEIGRKQVLIDNVSQAFLKDLRDAGNTDEEIAVIE